MSRKIFIALCFFFGYTHSVANSGDENVIDSLYNAAWDMIDLDSDLALELAEKQLEFSKSVNNKVGIAKAYYVTGKIHSSFDYFNLAALNYFKALEIIKNTTEPEGLRIKINLLQNLGAIYFYTFEFELSIKYYQDAIAVALNEGDLVKQCELYYNVAQAYLSKGEYDKALENYEIALKHSKAANSKILLGSINNAIGIVHDKMGSYPVAQQYYLEAIATTGENSPNLSIYISHLGENQFLQGNYQKSREYYLQALEISHRHNDTERIKWINNNIGDLYMQERNYSRAVSYYQKTIDLGNPDILDEKLKIAYKSIAIAYDSLKNHEMTAHFIMRGYLPQVEKMEKIKDDLVEQNAQYRMKEVEWQRQLADKETLLAQLKSWLNSGLAVFALFLIVFGYISRRLYLHYTVHKEMKRILMTPISEELERLERKNKGWDNDDDD